MPGWFGTDEQWRMAIAEHRWPKGFLGPNGEHDDRCYLDTLPLIQCCVCRHQTSVTAGTIFHKTHLPLREWFWIMDQTGRRDETITLGGLIEIWSRQYRRIHWTTRRTRAVVPHRRTPLALGASPTLPSVSNHEIRRSWRSGSAPLRAQSHQPSQALFAGNMLGCQRKALARRLERILLSLRSPRQT